MDNSVVGEAAGLHVMVVEDTADLALLLSVTLELNGAKVVVASDHFDRLFEPETWSGIDVALVDLMLGEETTGAEVLRYLCENQPYIRRVVLTAAESLASSVGELAHVSLLKPCPVNVLIDALKGSVDD